MPNITLTEGVIHVMKAIVTDTATAIMVITTTVTAPPLSMDSTIHRPICIRITHINSPTTTTTDLITINQTTLTIMVTEVVAVGNIILPAL